MENPPESPTGQAEHKNLRHADSEDEEDQFVYPGLENPQQPPETEARLPTSRQVHASPAQLESLYAAASSGDLPLLKKLFKTALDNGDVEPFSLANDASSRTGFTALHAAASRGYFEITTWRS